MKALSITLALALTMMAATSQAVCLRNKAKANALLSNSVGVLNSQNIDSVKVAMKTGSKTTAVDSQN